MKVAHFTGSDGVKIYYRYWIPSDDVVKGVVHILHGMAEHSKRYDEFATYLNTQNIAVYAQDHRGHGLTGEKETLGWFAQKDGFEKVVNESHQLASIIAKKYKNQKIVLLGHSMGSFIGRTLITKSPLLYCCAIFSGTGYTQGALGKVGKSLAYFRSLGKNSKRPDKVLDKLSFGSFNNAFKPNKTQFDWLSRDESEVQKYVDDPLCGFVCSSRFFYDLLSGIELAHKRSLAAKIPKSFPIMFISGTKDPVGNFSKGLKSVVKFYESIGLKKVTLKLVEDGRHELLNEINKIDIYKQIGNYIQRRIKG
ncbi:MAG: lysophospholipase [Sphaerochaetaceae bacterium]